MALVKLISDELERDLRAATQQVTKTAAAAETLLKNLDADRAKLTALLERVSRAAQEPR